MRAGWRQNRRGNVFMIFALALVPIVGLAGGAIDMSRREADATTVQTALDSALLSVVHERAGLDAAALKTRAREIFDENLAGSNAVIDEFSVYMDGPELVGEVRGHTPSTLLSVIGVDELAIRQEARVYAEEQKLEVALVLDTTGSMSGVKIDRLKIAANRLIDTLTSSTEDVSDFRVAVVPFATAVNVGPTHDSAIWIDGDGDSPRSGLSLAAPVGRLDLFDHLGVDWAGCVVSRPGTLALDDTAPTAFNPETLFVPLFAPDEPDAGGYYNSYLDDLGGHPGNPLTAASTDLERLVNLDKYGLPSPTSNPSIWQPVSPSISGDMGPNHRCTTDPITPLTTNYAGVKTKINAFVANGSTNLVEAMAWGWRVLSPTAPFTQGRAYDAEGNRKIIVFVTDGNNAYGDSYASMPLVSRMGASGYAFEGEIDPSLSLMPTHTEINAALDTRLTQVCDNAKAAGIEVFVVRLEMSDTSSLSLLQDCASSTEFFLDVTDSAQLNTAFDSIAEKIKEIHLSD